MLKPDQMPNLVRERRFEIVGGRRAIARKFNRRIKRDIRFDDRSARIVEQTRAPGILRRTKRRRIVCRDRDEIDSIAGVSWTDRLGSRSRFQELNISNARPMLQRAPRGANEVAAGFDVRWRRRKRSRERDDDGLA